MGTAPAKDFRDLLVWQKSHQLTLLVYNISSSFPKEERYGVTSQMRRAAASIPANIAEGFARISNKNKVTFYNISQGSLSVLKYFIILPRDLGYHKRHEELWTLAGEVSKLITALIKSIDKCR